MFIIIFNIIICGDILRQSLNVISWTLLGTTSDLHVFVKNCHGCLKDLSKYTGKDCHLPAELSATPC